MKKQFLLYTFDDIIFNTFSVNLFINSVSKNGILILFNNNRDVIDQKQIQVLMNESSHLLAFIHDFLAENNLKYHDIDNIVVVNGPGSFTWIRTVSLIVNSIAFSIPKLFLTPISFFDLLDDYPAIKSSSKRDLFVKKSKSDKIEIVNNDDFIAYLQENHIEKVHGDVATNFLSGFSLEFEVDYEKIIKHVMLLSEREIQPLYMKKPNIT